MREERINHSFIGHFTKLNWIYMNFDLHPQKLLMNLRKINYFSSLANSNFQHLKYKDHSPRNFTNPTSFLRAIQNHCLDKISKYYIYMHENTEKQKMETKDPERWDGYQNRWMTNLICSVHPHRAGLGDADQKRVFWRRWDMPKDTNI